MPFEGTRGSYSHEMHNNIYYSSQKRKLLGIAILLTFLLVVLAFLGTVFTSAHSATTAIYMLALKGRTIITTMAVQAITMAIHTPTLPHSHAVVYLNKTVIHTPTSTHTSTIVHSSLSLGAIVGICFAVVGGILLAIIFLFCATRFLAKRIEHLIGARNQPTENICEEAHSERARSVGDQAGENHCLRDLFGGSYSAGDNSVGCYCGGYHSERWPS
jgi:hypothetical protein